MTAPSGFWREFNSVVDTFVTRVMIMGVFGLLALVQALIASETLSDDAIAGLNNGLFMPTLYGDMVVVLLGMTALPVVIFIAKLGYMRYKYGSEMFNTEYWSDSA